MEGLESTLVFDVTMILQVVLIDLALGGDNSIVIGMAAKNLPKHLQKRAILYGTAGAICLRFIMAFIVSWLFQIPFLKTVGAILLVLIGIKLIGGNIGHENDIYTFPYFCTFLVRDFLRQLPPSPAHMV